MSDSASLTKTEDKITKKLDQMIEKAKSGRAFLSRVIYPMYQQFQLERWETENASEGQPWKPLNSLYSTYKKKRFGGGPRFKWVGGRHPWSQSGTWPTYPGAGTKMMIATGKLASAAIGPGSPIRGGEGFHRMMVTETKLVVSINAEGDTEYFKYASELRPTMKFSRAHINLMKEKYQEFMKSEKGVS